MVEMSGEFNESKTTIYTVALARKVNNGASVNQRFYGFAIF